MATWEEMKHNYPILSGRQEKDFRQHKNGGWIERTAKVTRSIIAEDSLVLDKAIVDMCELKGQSVIKGNAKVTLSSLDYMSMIGGNAVADRCTLSGGTIVGNALVKGSIIMGHSTVRDNAIIYNSVLEGESHIVGTSTFSICYVCNAAVNILKRAFLTEFADGSFTDIPLAINDQLIGHRISINADDIKIGCTKNSLNWLKENAKRMWEDHYSCIEEKDIDKIVEVVTTLQEVYNDNLERNG